MAIAEEVPQWPYSFQTESGTAYDDAMVVSAPCAAVTAHGIVRAAAVLLAGLIAVSAASLAPKAGEVTTLWQETFVYEYFRTEGEGVDIKVLGFAEGTRGKMAAVSVATDGGFCIAGVKQTWTPQDDPDDDVWVVRLDATGVVVFDRAFGGEGRQLANGVAAAPDGGCIVAGSTPGRGTDAWVLRVGAVGEHLWERAFGGPYTDGALAAAAMPNGDTVISSYESPSPDAKSVLRLDRFDSQGHLMWTRKPERIARGGRYIAALGGGHVLVTGALWIRDAPFGYSALEFDETGAEVWSATLDKNGWPRALVAKPGLGHVLAFYDEDAEPWPTVKVRRFDSTARELWRAETALFDDDVPRSAYIPYVARVAVLTDGGIALVVERDFAQVEESRFYTEHWLLRFDSEGRLRARHALRDGRPATDTVERMYAVAATHDGAVVILGATGWPRDDPQSATRVDVWLRKLDFASRERF